MQEGPDRSNTAPESGAVSEEAIVRTREPRMYSICSHYYTLRIHAQQSKTLLG